MTRRPSITSMLQPAEAEAEGSTAGTFVQNIPENKLHTSMYTPTPSDPEGATARPPASGRHGQGTTGLGLHFSHLLNSSEHPTAELHGVTGRGGHTDTMLVYHNSPCPVPSAGSSARRSGADHVKPSWQRPTQATEWSTQATEWPTQATE